MARPLRIEYEGATYHVMNRGNQRARVFYSKRHYELFLAKLARFCDEFEVDIHAYCCMPNHFHLLLTTRQANLSRFMQALLTSFTISLNRMRDSSGHVFQGRFKAQLVEAQRYLSEVSRYIHLNPLRTKRSKGLDLSQRQAELRDFRWSSYRILIGLAGCPGWIDTAPVLRTWGSAHEQRMANYQRYVEQALTVDLPSPFLSVQAQTILGSDSFVDKIRREYLVGRDVRDGREETSLKHLVCGYSIDTVLAGVAHEYGVAPADLLKRRSACAEARRLAMYMVATLCRHARPLSELAARFSVTGAGLSVARARIGRQLDVAENAHLVARHNRILDVLRRNELIVKVLPWSPPRRDP